MNAYVLGTVCLYRAYFKVRGPVSILYGPSAMLKTPTDKWSVSVMKHNVNDISTLDALAHALVESDTCTKAILHRVATEIGALLVTRTKRVDFERLVDTGAWMDAALLLVGDTRPAWSLRRIVYEDGMWFCSLSRQPGLPAELDDSADAFHHDLPLAILCALVESRRKPEPRTNVAVTPRVRPQAGFALCCENFT